MGDKSAEWDKGFDAFFEADGDEDVWIEALHHECDDWFWGFLDAQSYSEATGEAPQQRQET